jgi:RNA polymerase sigma-70 factor (ECF subfamily)
MAEADDAVQEAWLRLSRTDAGEIENLRAWLTTVVGRVCLNMLRARRTRREESLEDRLPDPVVQMVTDQAEGDPEQQALLADSVGLALLVVLETLTPPERLAFVLHDMFGMPFAEIGPIVGRSPTAARQLASRARRRVRAEAPAPDANLRSQRAVVDAFVEASRTGDLEALLRLLDPDVVLRADRGAVAPEAPRVVRGAVAVAEVAESFAHLAASARPAIVNGAAGVVIAREGRPFAVLGITVRGGRMVEIDILADPERLARLDPALFASGG